MATDTVIKGYGVDGNLPQWATEQSLQELISLQQSSTLRVTTTATATARDTASAITSSNNWLGKKITGIFGANYFTRLVQAIITGGAEPMRVGIIKPLQNFIGALSNIAFLGAGFHLLITALSVLTKKVLEASQYYSNFLDVGFSLNGSLLNMIGIAGRSAMSMGQLTDAISSHSKAIIHMSSIYKGELITGIDAFGTLSATVRESLYDVGQFGFTIDEVNNYLGDYLETQRLAGMNETLSNESRKRAAIVYLTELTNFAKIMGKSRKEIAGQIQDGMGDTSISAYLRGFPEEIRPLMEQNLRTMFGALASVGGEEIQTTFKDMLYGVQGAEESSALLLSYVPKVAKSLQQMISYSKSVSFAQLDEGIKRKLVNDELRKMRDGIGEINTGQWESLALLGRFNPIFKILVDFMANYPKEIDKHDKDNLDYISKLLLNWENIMSRFYGIINNIFGKTLEAIFDEGGMADRILKYILKQLNIFESYMEGLLASLDPGEDLWDEVRKKILQPLGKELAEMFLWAMSSGLKMFLKWLVYELPKMTLKWLTDVPINPLSNSSGDVGEAIWSTAQKEFKRQSKYFDSTRNEIEGKLNPRFNLQGSASGQEGNNDKLDELIRQGTRAADTAVRSEKQLKRITGQSPSTIF